MRRATSVVLSLLGVLLLTAGSPFFESNPSSGSSGGITVDAGANYLNTSNGRVYVAGSPSPTAGQVLTAADAGVGYWATPAGASCYDAQDIDFTTQPSASCPTNGACTLAGFSTWVKGNSANETAALQNVNGSGLTVTPSSSTDYYVGGPTRTAPYVWLPLSSIDPTWTQNKLIRIWVYLTDNASANYDNAIFGLDDNALTNVAIAKRGYGTAGQGEQSQLYRSGYNSGFVGPTFTLGSGNNVGVISLQGPAPATYYQYGSYSGGWPAETALSSPYYFYFSFVANQGWQITNPLGLFLGAQRSGSGTAYVVVFKRVRVQVCPWGA